MDALRILETAARIDWDYDEEAGVLYLSVGRPRKAVGIDIGDGVIVRDDEKKREVVGLTLLGVRSQRTEPMSGGEHPDKPPWMGADVPCVPWTQIDG